MKDVTSHQLSYIYESPPYTMPVVDLITKVYVVSVDWWETWCRYTGYGTEDCGERPQMIINSWIDFKDPKPELYVFLSKPTWRRLRNWYTHDVKKLLFIKNGNPDYNAINTIVSISDHETKKISVPLWYKLEQFEYRVKKKFKLTGTECKFYIKHDNGNEVPLIDTLKKLDELEFYDEVKIRVSVKGNIGDRTVRFKEGIDKYDEEEELKKALELSMQQEPEAKPLDLDNEQIEKFKSALRATPSTICLRYLPLQSLHDNLQEILMITSLK